MSTTETVRPLTAKEKAELEGEGWVSIGWMTWTHEDHGIVKYATFRWWANPWEEDARMRGPFSTVWAAIDYLKERSA